MCPHEESTRPRPANAWQLISQPDHALFHLFRVDDLIHCILLAIEKIDDENPDAGPGLSHVVGVCQMAEREIRSAIDKMETDLKQLPVH